MAVILLAVAVLLYEAKYAKAYQKYSSNAYSDLSKGHCLKSIIDPNKYKLISLYEQSLCNKKAVYKKAY